MVVKLLVEQNWSGDCKTYTNNGARDIETQMDGTAINVKRGSSLF